MRVLFVEDDESTVEDAIKRLRDGGHECTVIGFHGSKEQIAEFDPDVIVVDLLQGPAQERVTTGNAVFRGIWDQQFCPIIVYSAAPDLLEFDGKHPFVWRVQKGAGSPKEFAQAIEEVQPYAQGLRSTIAYVRRELSRVFRDMAPDVFTQFNDEKERQTVLIRSGRRRLAALMDGPPEGGSEMLKPWEHYLCPPLGEDLQLGDVLKARGKSDADPRSFRVVLTPSCDLVRSNDRLPKVAEVLLARCRPTGDGLAKTPIGRPSSKCGTNEAETNKLHDRLRGTLLSQGYCAPVIAFPEIKGKVPFMLADVRDLELAEIARIDDEYERVASIDSPFRELVSWAYMQVACRPGLPDRDEDALFDELIASLAESDDSEKT